MARGRASSTDHRLDGGHQPGCCNLIFRPGCFELLLCFWPQIKATPSIFGGLFMHLATYSVFSHFLDQRQKCMCFLLFFCPQNQMQREIKYALWSLPYISIPTVALFFAEVRGYSKLYDSVDESPLGKRT